MGILLLMLTCYLYNATIFTTPQGCGKSVVAREFAHVFGYAVPRMFPLYRELTARDLLQRRVTDTEGSTAWADSPLIRAAREGKSGGDCGDDSGGGCLHYLLVLLSNS